MGKRIVYCADCGKSLLEDEFARGRASVVADRPYCDGCRPVAAPAPPTRPLPPSTARIPLAPSTTRRAAAPASRGPSRNVLIAGAGLGALAVLLLIVALAPRKRDDPRLPPSSRPSKEAPASAPASSPASSSRPRPAAGGEEAGRLEREMREQKERDQARQFDAFLLQIRGMFERDRTLDRRSEIEGMIATALKSAGPRRAEVEKLQSDYRRRVEELARAETWVAHWKLDEGAGALASDATGHGHSGALAGGAAWTPGKAGGALAFDGVDGGVVVEAIAGLSPHAGPEGEMTLAAWVRVPQRPAATGQGRTPAVAKGKAGAWEYALYVLADGRAGFCLWTPGGSGYAEVSGGAVKLDQWHHLAGVVKKGKYADLYFDGAKANGLTAFQGETAAGPSPLYLGRRGDGQHFRGSVDDVRLYSRALSAAEIGDLFRPSGR